MPHRVSWSALLPGLVVLTVLAVASPASAEHRVGHDRPAGHAPSDFPSDFPVLVDSEWGFPLGGFGGTSTGGQLGHVPVILVHGNNRDASDWHEVRDLFLGAGWTERELWALSYNGQGRPGLITGNDVNVPDLAAFVDAVRSHTGVEEFSIVAHSLGVTLARRTLVLHPRLADDLVAFVGIAGANHGTSLCPPGSEPHLMSCDEIAAGTAWLAELNGPEGIRETWAGPEWMTIADGSGVADVAYLGPTYASSPSLRGADNRTFPGTDHNALRTDPSIVAGYRAFLEAAEVDVLADWSGPTDAPSRGEGPTAPDPATEAPPAAAPARPTPVTGAGWGLAALAMAAAGAAGTRSRRAGRGHTR